MTGECILGNLSSCFKEVCNVRVAGQRLLLVLCGK